MVFVSVTWFPISSDGMYDPSLSIYIYTVIQEYTEMDSPTGSIYLGDPRIDIHHLSIQNTHSIIPITWYHGVLMSISGSMQFVWILTNTGRGFIYPHNICCSSWQGILSYPRTLVLLSSSKDYSFSRVPFVCYASFGELMMIGCLPSSSAVSPYHDPLNLEMYSEVMFEWVWGL